MNGTLPATSAPASLYSNAASNGNSLTDKTMTGSQGELIKQELKEHHLNNIRIQYLKSLRDHLIKDQQMKEQYLKELTKKSSLVYPYLDMYEEVNKKKWTKNSAYEASYLWRLMCVTIGESPTE